jgi:hypothetical protein
VRKRPNLNYVLTVAGLVLIAIAIAIASAVGLMQHS